MKIIVEKELLSKTVDTLRDVNHFMANGFHNRAKEIHKDVLSVQNSVMNVLIVNPDAKPEKASKIIEEMLKLEVRIFGEEWQLNDKEAAELRNESDRLKNQLLSLVS